MKTTYRMTRISVVPTATSKELRTFAHMLGQSTGLAILANSGIDVPAEFEVTENSGGSPDEPPDISAFGYGFEHTEFPPTLTIIDKIHTKKGTVIIVPPFQNTGKNYGDVRREIYDPASKTNSSTRPGFWPLNKERCKLAGEFRALLESSKSKDKPGNDILLIDQRSQALEDIVVEPAIREVLVGWKLKYIRLIIMVRAKKSIQAWP